MALSHATKEAIWLRRLLQELRVENDGATRTTVAPTLIYEDNQSAIALAKNPVHLKK